MNARRDAGAGRRQPTIDRLVALAGALELLDRDRPGRTTLTRLASALGTDPLTLREDVSAYLALDAPAVPLEAFRLAPAGAAADPARAASAHDLTWDDGWPDADADDADGLGPALTAAEALSTPPERLALRACEPPETPGVPSLGLTRLGLDDVGRLLWRVERYQEAVQAGRAALDDVDAEVLARLLSRIADNARGILAAANAARVTADRRSAVGGTTVAVPVERSVPQRDVPSRAAASGPRPPVSGGETLARVLAAGDSNRLIRFTYTRHWNPGVRVYTVRVRRVVAGPGGWEVQGQVAERDWALRRFGLSRISDLDPDVGPVPAGQPSTPPSWQPAQHDVDLPKSLHWLTDRWAQKVEPVKGSPTALRLTLDQPADDRLALLLLLAGPTATTSRLKPRATAVEWARDLERAYETGLPRHVNAG